MTAPRAVRGEISVTVGAHAAELWPYVADTDRMDRAAGLPNVSFRTHQRPEGGDVVIGEYRLLGRPLARWIEHPFEWQWPHWFWVVRDYSAGPFLRFKGGTQLTWVPNGTRLRSFVEITPPNALFGPLLRWLVIPIGLRRAVRQHRAIAAFLSGRSAQPFPMLSAMRSRVDTVRLSAGLSRLRAEGVRAEVVDWLGGLLGGAADEDVAGMRPLELAERAGLDGREVLETFIRATVAGLLELRWELLCPRCRGVKANAQHLRQLSGGGFCPTCNLHFHASADEAIEARFYPSPGLRRAEVGTYCVGSPMKTPHRLAQVVLLPGASHAWQLDLATGAYQLTAPQSGGVARITVDGAGASEAEVEFAVEAPRPAEISLRPGGAGLAVRNASTVSMSVALDDARWSRTGATPGRLMTLPAFRTLLSDEALAPGFELALGRVGLLFTDLAGSTALYERIGDARAFRLVGEHFTLLLAPIEAAGGALVKTIGDAIMAAFPDGRSALRAALSMQRAMRDFPTGGAADPARLLKIGVHVGACFAVTLNDRLDYFGTAVNLAARAQHEARGGEIVLTGDVLADAADLAGDAASFEVELRGFSAPVRLYRLLS